MVKQVDNLETFVNLIKSNDKNIEELNGLELIFAKVWQSSEQCAQVVSFVLNELQQNCPKNLTFNFQNYSYSVDAIALAIADAIKHNNYPEGFYVDFTHKDFLENNKCIEVFADSLASGNCTKPLRLGLTGVCIPILASAIQSKKCPKGFHLILNNNNLGKKVDFLAEAIQSPGCPEDFHLSINDPSVYANVMMMSAVASRRCKPGLRIDISVGGSMQPILSLLGDGSLPQRFHLHFQKTMLCNYDTTCFVLKLEKMLAKKNLPAGFNITFDSDIFPDLMYPSNKNLFDQLQTILQKNNAYHAAQACITLQQGHRQPDNIFASLPQEMMGEIYSHTMDGNPKPFLKNLETIFHRHGLFKPKEVGTLIVPSEKLALDSLFSFNKS